VAASSEEDVLWLVYNLGIPNFAAQLRLRALSLDVGSGWRFRGVLVGRGPEGKGRQRKSRHRETAIAHPTTRQTRVGR